MKEVGIEHESNKICTGPKYLYETELERYARFLELYIRFYEYNKLSLEQRAEEKQKARNSTKNRIREQNKQVKQKHMDSCQSAGVDPLLLNNTYWGNVYVIPDCDFNCGYAPCDCPERWKEFEELAKEFGEQNNWHPKIFQKTTLEEMFRIKKTLSKTLLQKIRNKF